MARRGVFDAIMAKEDYMQPEQHAVPVKLVDATTQDPDELVECPYEKVHRIRMSRFPMHLLKCRKNYVGKEMFTCPFNARHLVPAPEARHHVATCPDKACIEKDLVNGYDLNNTYCKGYTKVPSYTRHEEFNHDPTENWDEEITSNQGREYWGPSGDGQESGGERGAHHLPTPRGRGAPRAVGTTRQQQPEMRLPRQPAQAAAVAQQRHQQMQQRHQQPQATPLVNGTTAAPGPAPNVAGLGRGQFKGRVMAANLWGPPAPNQGQDGQPRPGGLGQSSWGTKPVQNGSSSPFVSDDFPPLAAPQPAYAGIGRGLGRGFSAVNQVPPTQPGGLQNGTM